MKKPYLAFNDHLKSTFGERVYRVSIDAGFDCPNRDGLLAVGGCTYCDEGTRSPGVDPTLSVRDQMKTGMERMKKISGASKFIAYFQAFTNTYSHVDVLKERYWAALDLPNVVGLAVSTRPDTLSSGALNLIESIGSSFPKPFETWLELGLQTIHDKTNERLNRWHTYAQFKKALFKAKEKKNIKICVHVILGLPGETIENMHQTINEVVKLPIDGIKIHNLHVIKNTALAKEYEQGEFSVFDEENYVSLICDILEKLPPSMIIHRLTGEAARDKMIAPMWVLNKGRVLHKIEETLKQRGTYQGSHFVLDS
jgi:uncharacterized protein